MRETRRKFCREYADPDMWCAANEEIGDQRPRPWSRRTRPPVHGHPFRTNGGRDGRSDAPLGEIEVVMRRSVEEAGTDNLTFHEVGKELRWNIPCTFHRARRKGLECPPCPTLFTLALPVHRQSRSFIDWIPIDLGAPLEVRRTIDGASDWGCWDPVAAGARDRLAILSQPYAGANYNIGPEEFGEVAFIQHEPKLLGTHPHLWSRIGMMRMWIVQHHADPECDAALPRRARHSRSISGTPRADCPVRPDNPVHIVNTIWHAQLIRSDLGTENTLPTIRPLS